MSYKAKTDQEKRQDERYAAVAAISKALSDLYGSGRSQTF